MTVCSLSPSIDPVCDMLSPQFDLYSNLYTTQGTLKGSTTQKNTQAEGTTYRIQDDPLGLDYMAPPKALLVLYV